jgi:hypothetical protein
MSQALRAACGVVHQRLALFEWIAAQVGAPSVSLPIMKSDAAHGLSQGA